MGGTMAGMGFPGGSAGKESVCNAGDLGSIPGLGRSPGEGNDYSLQYSGLENSMDYIVHGVAKSWTQLNDFHFQRLRWTHLRDLGVGAEEGHMVCGSPCQCCSSQTGFYSRPFWLISQVIQECDLGMTLPKMSRMEILQNGIGGNCC